MRLALVVLLIVLIAFCDAKPKKKNGKGNKKAGKSNDILDIITHGDKKPQSNRDKIKRGGKSKVERIVGDKLEGKAKDHISQLSKNKKESKIDDKGYQFAVASVFDDEFAETLVIEERFKGLKVMGRRIFERVPKKGKGGKVKLTDKDGKNEKTVEIKDEGETFVGSFEDDLELDLFDLDPDSLDEHEAIAVLEEYFAEDGDPVIECEAEIHIDQVFDDAAPMPIFNCLITFTDTFEAWQAYVDAETYEILEIFSAMQITTNQQLKGTGNGGNAKVGKKAYTDLAVNENGTSCSFGYDQMKLFNCHGATTWAECKEVQFACYNNPDLEINGAYNQANDYIHWTAQFEKLFKDWYKLWPLKDSILHGFVNFPDPCEAYFSPSTPFKIVLGTWIGCGIDVHPAGVADVFAHEMGHAITQLHSNLEYKDVPSGGLNEGFSDLTGITFDWFLRGRPDVTSSNWDWNIGDDWMKAAGKALRCMDNPACEHAESKGIDHVSKYTQAMKDNPPRGYMYTLMGIPSKVFVEISKKLSFQIWDAYDIFFYANTRGYWPADANFNTAAAGTLKVATLLKNNPTHFGVTYTYDQNIVQVTKDAWELVGVKCTTTNNEDYTCTE